MQGCVRGGAVVCWVCEGVCGCVGRVRLGGCGCDSLLELGSRSDGVAVEGQSAQ